MTLLETVAVFVVVPTLLAWLILHREGRGE